MSATTQEDVRVSRMTMKAINKVMETLNREKERLAAKIGAPPENWKPDEKPKLRPAAATGVWETLTDAANEQRDRENAPRKKAEAARIRAPWEQPYRPPARRQEYVSQPWPQRQGGRDDRAARMAQELAAEVMALILSTVQRLIHGKPQPKPQLQEQQAAPEQRSPWPRPSMDMRPGGSW